MDERTLSLVLRFEVAIDLALIVVGVFVLLLTEADALIPIALVIAGLAGLVVAVVLYRIFQTRSGGSPR